MKDLKGKTAIVTGATRGIGQAIALKLATHGANLVILAKDSEENIEKTRELLTSLGSQALVLNVDLTNIQRVEEIVANAADQFGGVDVLVNNTSATCFENVVNLSPEQFDLMIATSVKAAFFLSKYCLPHLKRAPNPHIINISPPLNIDPHWFENYLGFSISKYSMSLCTLGMAETFRSDRIAVNSLWPKSTIATQTIEDHFSSGVYSASRRPSIMADAAYQLILRDSNQGTGQFYIDEDLLREEGVSDFSQYAVNPDLDKPLMQALFMPEDEHMVAVPPDSFLRS